MASSQSASGTNIVQADNGSTAIVNIFHAGPPCITSAEDIAAAAALIKALPLDTLPAPGDLPSASYLPWSRNRHFVGREDVLLELAGLLKIDAAGSVGQSPVITGLGGQGKTQLAVEFAYRFGRWFTGGVFWINCGNPETIPQAIAACAAILRPDDAGVSARPISEQVAAVGAAFASPIPRLLIFDNCDDERIFEAWSPRAGGCRLLVTSRRVSWSPARGIILLPLGALNRSESLRLLCSYRPDLTITNPQLAELAGELGDLPLALELAGSYLRLLRYERSGDPAAYLRELRGCNPIAHFSLTAEQSNRNEYYSLTGHDRDIARTFSISFRQLEQEEARDKYSKQLFAYAGWLAPGEPISRDLLKLFDGVSDDNLLGCRNFTYALQRLIDLSLLVCVSSDDGDVVIHPLLAAFSRLCQAGEENFRNTIEIEIGKWAIAHIKQDDPRPIRPLESHLLMVALHSWRDRTNLRFELANVIGTYYTLIGFYNQSVGHLENALREAEATPDASFSAVVAILTNLGVVQTLLGRLSAAQNNLERACRITETEVGDNSPALVGILINLSGLQFRCGQLDRSVITLNRALRIERESRPVSDQQLATILTNLGPRLREQGKLTEAEEVLREALAIKLRLFTENHPQVAFARGNLGIVLRQQDRLVESYDELRTACSIWESSHGPTHPEFARVLSALGTVHQRLHRPRDAKKAFFRALSIRKRTLGSTHSDYATTLDHIGTLYSELNQFKCAEFCLNSSLEIRQQVLPNPHVDIGLSLWHVADFYRKIGRFPFARAYYAAAWAVFTDVLGEEHHYSIDVRVALWQIASL